MAPKYDTNTTADQLVGDFANEIKGKVILTTGVTPGALGAAFVEAIAKAQPSLLILAGRSEEKLQKEADRIRGVQADVKIKQLTLDLNSFDEVRKSAKTFNGWADVPYVDIVVNSAGLMATPYQTTKDGFESQFGVNHLGTFLFTNLIMAKVLASKTPRIVTITSDGHRLNPIRWHDLNFDKGETYNKWHAYGQSKTGNMLMTTSLAEKLGSKKGLTAVSLHPGAVEGTNLGAFCNWEVDYPALMAADKALGNPEGWATEFDFKSQQRGVATFVYAAFAPELKEKNGAYCIDSRIGDPYTDTIKPWATSSLEADRLWKLSEKLVGEQFAY